MKDIDDYHSYRLAGISLNGLLTGFKNNVNRFVKFLRSQFPSNLCIVN